MKIYFNLEDFNQKTPKNPIYNFIISNVVCFWLMKNPIYMNLVSQFFIVFYEELENMLFDSQISFIINSYSLLSVIFIIVILI